jgi:DNA-binding transcriptional LysR family regulator
MQDLNDLYYYAQVVEHGGFAPAGRALNLPKSKLSRRIALLEERLGVRLIQRSSRRFSVTDIGQTYYGHCKAMLVQAEAAAEAIALTQAEPCGTVRLSCPVLLMELRVADMLAAFMVRYPQVEVVLEDTNRRVDVLGEGLDLAIRVRPPPLEDSDLVLRELGPSGQCLVAAPGLWQGRAAPRTPADLAAWPSVALAQVQQQHSWHLYGPEHAQAVVHHQPRLITRSMHALLAAALAGVGIAQLPSMLVQQPLASATLVRVLPDWAPRRELVHAVYPSRRGQLPAVRLLLDALAQGFAAYPDD